MGTTLEGDLLDNHIVSYFQTLFMANIDKVPLDSILNMFPRIDVTMSSELSQDFTENEILRALKQRHPTKALGPDGMPPLFFQHHWHIMGPSITKALLLALNSG